MKRNPITLWAASAILVASTSLVWLASCGGGGQQDVQPPLSIGPLQQARLLEGQQAKAVVDAMHPLPTSPLRSWVGYYGGGIGITIYASKFPSPAEATSALDAMRTAIANGKSGFTPPEPRTAGGQAGFHTTGMSKEHFYFSRDAWVVWIEGKPGDFDPTVKALRWGKASKS